MLRNRFFWVLLAAIVILVAVAMIDPAVPADKEVKVAQFKTVFTITYNSLTLEQAAALEKIVREQHEKACDVKVVLYSNDGNISAIGFGSYGSVYGTVTMTK